MKCSQIKEMFPDFLIGEINETIQKKIQEHVAVCDSCREELESLSAIWTKLGVLPEEQPSSNVRTRFYSALEKYKQSQEQEKTQPNLGKLLKGWLEPRTLRRPALLFSSALLILVVGLVTGYFLHSSKQRDSEISRLRQDVLQIRKITAVSLIRQESLNKRLKVMGWSSQTEQSEEETIATLLRVLNSDIKIDKSQTPIDIFDFLYNYSINKEGFTNSLSKQTSPLVRIALSLGQHVKNL